MAKLYGIGAGPGDPELLTLKARRVLNEADVIFCPETQKGRGSFAYDIIKGQLDPAKAEIVNLVYPMNCHGEQLKEMWEKNAKDIAARLEGNRTGVFITLGDPAIYSTFMYTLPFIESRGITVEIVPGIPSFCAVADAMKLPLAAWDEDLIVFSVSRNNGGELRRVLREHDNIVLMKPSANQKALVEAIRENRLQDSFVMVSKAGTDEEHRVTSLTELEQYDIPYLSTIIIKKKHR